jgi:hypothetical protein
MKQANNAEPANAAYAAQVSPVSRNSARNSDSVEQLDATPLWRATGTPNLIAILERIKPKAPTVKE